MMSHLDVFELGHLNWTRVINELAIIDNHSSVQTIIHSMIKMSSNEFFNKRRYPRERDMIGSWPMGRLFTKLQLENVVVA